MSQGGLTVFDMNCFKATSWDKTRICHYLLWQKEKKKEKRMNALST